MWIWIEKERLMPMKNEVVLWAWQSIKYVNGKPISNWSLRIAKMCEYSDDTMKRATHWARITLPQIYMESGETISQQLKDSIALCKVALMCNRGELTDKEYSEYLKSKIRYILTQLESV